jgi:hypothetical protein
VLVESTPHPPLQSEGVESALSIPISRYHTLRVSY